MNETDEKRIDPSVTIWQILVQQLTGVQDKYYSNGQLKERCTYKDDYINGIREKRQLDGTITRALYKEGERVGESEVIKDFTPREEFLKLNNLNPDGTRKQETKQILTPKRKGGIKR